MLKRIQYTTPEEKQSIINSNSHLILVESQELFEGNFLIFSDTPPEKEIVYINVPERDFNNIKSDNTLLKVRTQANADTADFHEELIVELAMQIYD